MNDQPAPREAMVSLIQTTIGTVLGPLVAELAASRQTIERHAETIGDLRAENRALRAAQTQQASNLTVETSEPTTGRVSM